MINHEFLRQILSYFGSIIGSSLIVYDFQHLSASHRKLTGQDLIYDRKVAWTCWGFIVGLFTIIEIYEYLISL